MEAEYLYVVGLGDDEDWRNNRGSLYSFVNHEGETVLFVFTTPERAQEYVETFLLTATAHVDMMETVEETHVEPLTGGRFVVMAFDNEGLAEAALMVGADILVRDFHPDEPQQSMRLPKFGDD